MNGFSLRIIIILATISAVVNCAFLLQNVCFKRYRELNKKYKVNELKINICIQCICDLICCEVHIRIRILILWHYFMIKGNPAQVIQYVRAVE